jgi:hypothetical protein
VVQNLEQKNAFLKKELEQARSGENTQNGSVIQEDMERSRYAFE